MSSLTLVFKKGSLIETWTHLLDYDWTANTKDPLVSTSLALELKVHATHHAQMCKWKTVCSSSLTLEWQGCYWLILLQDVDTFYVLSSKLFVSKQRDIQLLLPSAQLNVPSGRGEEWGQMCWGREIQDCLLSCVVVRVQWDQKCHLQSTVSLVTCHSAMVMLWTVPSSLLLISE